MIFLCHIFKKTARYDILYSLQNISFHKHFAKLHHCQQNSSQADSKFKSLKQPSLKSLAKDYLSARKWLQELVFSIFKVRLAIQGSLLRHTVSLLIFLE